MTLKPIALLLAGAALAGCGSTAPSTTAPHPGPGAGTKSRTPVAAKPRSLALRVAGAFKLPEGREGAAAASALGQAEVIGGLGPAGSSTTSVYVVSRSGQVTSGPSLPAPVHDAAAAWVAGKLLLFGGGVSEGSDNIVQVMPGTPRLIGHMPKALSDLTATTIGQTVYLAGGWDGTRTNTAIYAVKPDGSVTTAGQIPLGVRYPDVASLAGKLVVAGGEQTNGDPTAGVWSFDPNTGKTSPLPPLPAPADHGAAVARDGALYVMGGLRRGSPTSQILALTPGAPGWVTAGHLPVPVNKPAATALNGGIAVVGGLASSGALTDSVTLLHIG